MKIARIITASAAQSELYSLIKEVSAGTVMHEIHLRDSKPVVLMSKEEMEGLLETISVLSSPEEMRAIENGRQESTSISHEEVVRKLTLNYCGKNTPS